MVTLNTGQLETALAFGFLPVGLALAKATSRASEGVPDFVKEEFGGQFDLDSITIVGERTAPDVEKILTLEPDLILTNKRVDEAILKKLEAIAPVVLTNGGGENWKEDLRIMGEALGKEEVAASMLKEYEDKAADFAKKNSAHPTVSLLRNKGDEYVMHGNRSLAGIVARDCGFHRPASQDFEDEQHKAVSPENLDVLEADYMFYGFTKAGQALEESTFWKDLNVVKDGNAHAVDVEPWYLNASVVAANRVMADMQKPIG
ncbi:MAG TPA: iron-siderophore ABC transporter substrate-binding protein [Candidatus Corynebacterium gallistercoris]|uniref:Iron-siderophore ABC transporter substrate-binding protein n=1 Tax=Candidatus Corynebacterium gallistercoris TaxID=2838530 RepID=A0A9D1RZ02_9CORY|nr:iron-siderophore ABC transporter substrate-binding protein [Candidatus Corynebacterium gallistercoris]